MPCALSARPAARHSRPQARCAPAGRPRPGGQTRIFLNLCAGLDKLGIPYRVNDYRYIERHPDELACIIGKPHVLDKISWRNPIMFGAAVHSHPLADPDLLDRLPVRKVLVPGEWMRQMCEPYYGEAVTAWEKKFGRLTDAEVTGAERVLARATKKRRRGAA